MELRFRKLKANEIDVRIGTITYNKPKDKSSGVKGASFLLYKDARVDMALLDEVVGPMNWQRTHEFKDGKLYCKVGIRYTLPDGTLVDWVWKEDVGVESNTEAEKGQASDSFKRACFNWGIGRELYTAPFIYLKQSDFPNEDLTYLKLFVNEIEYKDDEISKLVLVDSKGNLRYTYGCKEATKKPKVVKTETKVAESKPEEPTIRYATNEQIEYISSFGDAAIKWCLSKYKVEKMGDLTFENASEIINEIKKGKKQ